MTYRFISTLFLSLLLVACGGSNDGSTRGNVDNDGPVLFISDVSGVWDVSEIEDGLLDEMYVFIREDGVISYFDYLGDEYDNLSDCYLEALDVGQFLPISGNLYLFDTDEEQTEVFVSTENGDLLLDSDDSLVVWSPTNQRLSDFVPLCP